jgi:monothiol glutaredoxin
MTLSEPTRERIERFLQDNRVVLFMKGTPQQPMCGFSAQTVAALDSVLPEYHSVNVLEDQDIREGIKVFGNWPTIPQLYIDGELVGGCDIVVNMLNTGELHECLGLEAPDRTPPEVHISDSAASRIREAMSGHEGIALQFHVDANWNAQFNLAQPQGHEITTESNDITILMDLATAQRARGARIDWVSSVQGEGLAIDLPLAPPAVKQMSVQDLAVRLESGGVVLVDVRGPEDRERASLSAARALDKETMAELEQLPKDTALAFICHHGNASMGAAEYFRKQGFTDVSNVAGGIHAWSLEVDPSVPTY